MADRVRIYEVGPRDGLQNESLAISLETKVKFIDRLAAAGLREIEATSFVSPKAIPQLADADALLPRLSHTPEVRYPVLVPNERGMARAEAAGAKALAVFTAATDAFTERNIGMTIESPSGGVASGGCECAARARSRDALCWPGANARDGSSRAMCGRSALGGVRDSGRFVGDTGFCDLRRNCSHRCGSQLPRGL